MNVLLDWGPERSPLFWIAIDCLLASASLALLADLVLALSNKEKRAFASAWYLSWNLFLCLFWVVETALETLHHKAAKEPPQNAMTWELWLFWILAVYFFVESVEMVWERWPVKEHLVTAILDEIVNAGAYGYMAGRLAYKHEYCCWCYGFMRDDDDGVGSKRRQQHADDEGNYFQLGETNDGDTDKKEDHPS